MITIKKGYTFDDILIEPNFSSIKKREDVNLSVKIKDFTFNHPIIPANMKSVMGPKMIEAILESRGLAIHHRFDPIEDQIELFNSFKDKYDVENYFAFSVGVKQEDYDNLDKIVKSGAKIICVDIAHGDSTNCIRMVKTIKSKYNKILVIAGNIATVSGAQNLKNAGADVLKVGVGNGATCLTRINTGNGVPQMTALMDVRQYLDENGSSCKVIADGGIRNPGDAVKALCCADMVMSGSVFAGCPESAGTTIYGQNGISYKQYEGSSTLKKNYVEGVKGLVKSSKPFASIIKDYKEGIASGCSYQGLTDVSWLKNNPTFIIQSSAGLKESGYHDVILQGEDV